MFHISEFDSGGSEEENKDDTTTTLQAIRNKDDGKKETDDSDVILIGMLLPQCAHIHVQDFVKIFCLSLTYHIRLRVNRFLISLFQGNGGYIKTILKVLLG